MRSHTVIPAKAIIQVVTGGSVCSGVLDGRLQNAFLKQIAQVGHMDADFLRTGCLRIRTKPSSAFICEICVICGLPFRFVQAGCYQ